ncbi:MAG: hypothetical protein QXO46_08325 [Nitrososphaerota archaeon]
MAQRYVHLLPVEREIWDRWMQKYGNLFYRYEYDVRVGEGIEVRPEWGDEIARMAKLLTMKRIDVVAYRHGEIWIIEVKPHVGTGAYGQIKVYEKLLRKKVGDEAVIRLAFVCETIDPDVEKLLIEEGITVWKV